MAHGHASDQKGKGSLSPGIPPGCHEKDLATAPLPDKQVNTVAAVHHLVRGKEATPHDQKSLLMGSHHFINSRLLSVLQAGQSDAEENHWLSKCTLYLLHDWLHKNGSS